MAKNLSIVHEYFSQREQIRVRAESLKATWEALGEPKRVRAYGDPAGAQDRVELNAALRRLRVPWRVMQAPRGPLDSIGRDKSQRVGMVTRLNMMLGAGALSFAHELDRGPGWRKGQHAASEGFPMQGSRLMWEIKNWRYPEPREGQAQPQDPDDDSADGADCIAALRYLVSGYLKPAPAPKVEPKFDRNVDTRLERMAAAMKEAERRGRWRTGW